MRNLLGIVTLLLLAAGGYAYFTDLDGFQKFVDDTIAKVSGTAPNTDTAPASPASSATTGRQAASSAPSNVPPPAPKLPPVKRWMPPDPLPAQPNWTWTALDGTTYQNVVVTSVGPETVSITHSMGVTHLPINTLPPDVQKQLNYDPASAAAARKEHDREEDHPFYPFADHVEAQNVARQLSWPVAWMDAFPDDMNVANPDTNSKADLTQTTVAYLKSRAIIVFANGNVDLGRLPGKVHDQFMILDDGPMPGGHHFYAPKIAFSDADVTTIYGRVSSTQLGRIGTAAFDGVLNSIPADSRAPSDASAAVPDSAATLPLAPSSPSPASATASSTPAPETQASQPSIPPAVLPAQPNWTWTTLDGKTYQDVVITEIGPDTVSITHSLGVAHIPLNLLPADIKKQLTNPAP